MRGSSSPPPLLHTKQIRMYLKQRIRIIYTGYTALQKLRIWINRMGENVHRRSRKERKSISEDNVNLWMWQISADNPSLSVANARKIDTRYAQTYWRDFKEIVFSYIQHTLSVYLSLSLPIFLPCLSICILLSSFSKNWPFPASFLLPISSMNAMIVTEYFSSAGFKRQIFDVGSD